MLVTYDINTETAEGRARLRRVAKTCEGFGQRVQKSVFECQVTQAQYEEMKRRLLRLIDDREDNLRLYRLMDARGRRHVEAFGLDMSVDFREPLVV